jgi:hypothetical protein
MNAKKRIVYVTALLAFVTALVVVFFVARRPTAPTSSGVGVWGPSSYWFPAAEAGKKPLAGSDQGSVMMGIWFHHDGHSDPAFVVWVGEAGGGRLAARTELVAKGTHERACIYDGALADVALECRTSDGKTGTVKIGGAAYELDKGALFLVSKTGGEPRVKQLKLAVLNLKPEGTLSPDQMTHEYLRGLTKTNPEIKEFFTVTDQPK